MNIVENEYLDVESEKGVLDNGQEEKKASCELYSVQNVQC